MRLNLRKLELFCAIARTGSTMAGAEAMSLSQSATSAALADLESILGATLFDRVGKRLVLNDAGRALLPEALDLLDRAQVLEERFTLGATNARTHFRLAVSTTIGNYLLPALIADFRAQMPHVTLDVWIGNTQAVAARVQTFEADLGMIEGACHTPDLKVIRWRDDELVIVASASDPLARESKKSPIKATRLKTASWLLREAGSGTREMVEHSLLPHLHHLESGTTLGSSEAIKHGVVAGLGISCLSRVLVQDMLDDGRLCELLTTLPRLERTLSLVYRSDKKLSSALTAFLKLCMQSKD